jgi:multidrug resistance efflux pump
MSETKDGLNENDESDKSQSKRRTDDASIYQTRCNVIGIIGGGVTAYQMANGRSIQMGMRTIVLAPTDNGYCL